MTEAAAKKVIRRRPLPKKQPEALDPGDLVEFATTVEVKTRRGTSLWIKGGCTSTVRPSETGPEAHQRIVDFVMSVVNAQVQEAIS